MSNLCLFGPIQGALNNLDKLSLSELMSHITWLQTHKQSTVGSAKYVHADQAKTTNLHKRGSINIGKYLIDFEH